MHSFVLQSLKKEMDWERSTEERSASSEISTDYRLPPDPVSVLFFPAKRTYMYTYMYVYIYIYLSISIYLYISNLLLITFYSRISSLCSAFLYIYT